MMLNKIFIKKQTWLTVVTLCTFTINAYTQQSYTDKVKRYVDAYNELAIEEQARCGIPAAVTLGQGILETEAGCSELATKANNHFGIKCKKEWKGPTMAHTDDAPNECFRKYSCARDSYKDHSDYLKGSPRYAMLFKLSTTDYAAWAFGLKRCGYATNPVYAQKLIKIIEDYQLQEYTYRGLNENIVYKEPKPKEDKRYNEAFNGATPAIDTPIVKKAEEAAEEAQATIITTPVAKTPLQTNIGAKQSTGILKINDLKAIKAYKGDMLLQYAVQYGIRYERLLEYNDLPDAPLAADMYLYLEKKPSRGTHEKHVVRRGETMWQIAQDEPMQLQRLLSYNKMQSGEEAAPGSVLKMQGYADMKPMLSKVPDFMDDEIPKKADPVKMKQDDYVEKIKISDSPYRVKTETLVVPQPVKQEEPAQAAVAQETTKDTPAAKKTQEIQQEEKPAPQPQGPQDELSMLKAKLDKVVYADENKPKPAPAPKPVAPVTTQAVPAQEKPRTPEKVKKATPVSAAHTKYHIVKKGDTAFNISVLYHMKVAELMELNKMTTSKVAIGQKLKVK